MERERERENRVQKIEGEFDLMTFVSAATAETISVLFANRCMAHKFMYIYCDRFKLLEKCFR